jgi:hypothetical protein
MPARLATDDDAILALTEAGKTSREIEAILKYDHTTICRRLKHLTPRQSTEIFKEHRADIFAEKQRKLMMRSNGVDIKDERDLAVAMAVYYDKERIERGHSSEGKPLVIINRISVNADSNRVTNVTDIEPE